ARRLVGTVGGGPWPMTGLSCVLDGERAERPERSSIPHLERGLLPQSGDTVPRPWRRCHSPCAPSTSSPPLRRSDRWPLRPLVLAGISGRALCSIALGLGVRGRVCSVTGLLGRGGLRLGHCPSFIFHLLPLVRGTLDITVRHARRVIVEKSRGDVQPWRQWAEGV